MDMTWYTRELPVLEAAVQLVEESDSSDLVNVPALAEHTGLDRADVAKALRAMSGTYIETRSLSAEHIVVAEILPEGRRAAGQWPTAELIVERVLAGIQQAADTEPDPEKKSKLKQTAVFLGSSGKDLFINLLASVIAKSAGLG
ncbi:hypothetical protein [Dactylosporangium darangshiense]|uniref:Uncharacterized protein n=1 Tax=Dactylosporangium darangshiense TaxID=579108 RepID=A0ABP8DN42_9ACTN